MTGWGVDHSFECIGNVNVMRAALECAHRGWGQSVIIGGPARARNLDAAVPAGHHGRPQVAGHRVRRCEGRSQLPGMVEDAMAGDIQLAPFVTHTMPLDDINRAFDLMHGASRSAPSSTLIRFVEHDVAAHPRDVPNSNARRGTMAISIHPSVDNGVNKGDPEFFGGTLQRNCASDKGRGDRSTATSRSTTPPAVAPLRWKPMQGRGVLRWSAWLPRDKLAVTANAGKLGIVDEKATIQRHAGRAAARTCTAASRTGTTRSTGSISSTRTRRSQGWEEPRLAAFVSHHRGRRREARADGRRRAANELGLPPYDALQPCR